ncbi:MAG: hypothetical protein E7019_06665 [Alphaproteobacteria bacterium]|nr:hypothetical protein [Alphaproteobacteria bacterium]
MCWQWLENMISCVQSKTINTIIMKSIEKKFRKFAIVSMANVRVGLEKIISDPYPTTKEEAIKELFFAIYTKKELCSLSIACL